MLYENQSLIDKDFLKKKEREKGNDLRFYGFIVPKIGKLKKKIFDVTNFFHFHHNNIITQPYHNFSHRMTDRLTQLQICVDQVCK